MTLKRKMRNYFKKVSIRIIRQRQLRAAQDTARYLVNFNDDFRGVSEIDLTQAIMSKKQIRWADLGR